MITSTGVIPKSDPYSYTRSGEPWIAHEWLSEIIIYYIYRGGDYYLLIPVFAAIITLSFYLVYLRSSGNYYVAGFLTLFSSLSSAPTWGVRPQTITVLFTALFLYVLDVYRVKKRFWTLAALPVLIVLWVNLHGGYIIGLALIGIYVIAETIHIIIGFFRKDIISLRIVVSLIITFISCVVASLLNPNYHEILSYPFKTIISPSMMQFIQEWFTPDFHQLEWIPLAILILALIAIPTIFKKPTKLVGLLLVLVFTFASFRSMRFSPMLALVAIPFLADQMVGVLNCQPKRISAVPFKQIYNAFIVLLLCSIVGVYTISIYQKQPLIETSSFPKGAVDWIKINKPKGNIYNTYGWGGYLIWHLHPDYPIYIDGRADLYGDSFIYSYINIYTGQTEFVEYFSRQGVNIALVEPGSGLSSKLISSPEWKLVYTDSLSNLYIRNTR